jgi:5,10-methenyltetrahydrofolate synthetase
MTTPSSRPSWTPSLDKASLRRQLLAERQTLLDRHERAMQLQEVLRVWLAPRRESRVGTYWAIKGEFDTLPALYRWSEADDKRQIGLPVVHRESHQLRFHVWHPGCEMEADAYGIPKPKDTATFEPTLLLVPCVGYGDRGVRLGYGGGFFDRTLAQLQPRPFTVGLAYSHGYVPWLQADPTDIPLDVILTEDGVVWPAEPR